MEKDDIIICRCEEISRGEIVEALRHGCKKMDDVKRVTRAGMGLCQGKTCRPLVARVMAEATGVPVGTIRPSSFRPPVRPLKMKQLAEETTGEK